MTDTMKLSEYRDWLRDLNWSRAVLEYQIESNLYGRQGNRRHCGLDPQSPKERRNAA